MINGENKIRVWAGNGESKFSLLLELIVYQNTPNWPFSSGYHFISKVWQYLDWIKTNFNKFAISNHLALKVCTKGSEKLFQCKLLISDLVLICRKNPRFRQSNWLLFTCSRGFWRNRFCCITFIDIHSHGPFTTCDVSWKQKWFLFYRKAQ